MIADGADSHAPQRVACLIGFCYRTMMGLGSIRKQDLSCRDHNRTEPSTFIYTQTKGSIDSSGGGTKPVTSFLCVYGGQ
jgi:hypothetical protein